GWRWHVGFSEELTRWRLQVQCDEGYEYFLRQWQADMQHRQFDHRRTNRGAAAAIHDQITWHRRTWRLKALANQVSSQLIHWHTLPPGNLPIEDFAHVVWPQFKRGRQIKAQRGRQLGAC